MYLHPSIICLIQNAYRSFHCLLDLRLRFLYTLTGFLLYCFSGLGEFRKTDIEHGYSLPYLQPLVLSRLNRTIYILACKPRFMPRALPLVPFVGQIQLNVVVIWHKNALSWNAPRRNSYSKYVRLIVLESFGETS